ncbi:MAG TPA: bifunctional demethylmenaquinone methyltransferase/2-methoxy-6-polyprenyl-1,4-benzoquinol methylase UbiE [Oligoflexia bacterium]|nr:bifunctional demethylmenaquinone methyltransferase/2-methoxy-6-polyprenyl-1,4-benzoquinol methylase UbiE [Oligoflexia bacterium]HMP27864.1 bifunctional demethylmenaquinone methyltransferase/2-methoxy-6-polyprenyl-1,4-benzoquinol methylase UbiE [Oligoflexia bacterium]
MFRSFQKGREPAKIKKMFAEIAERYDLANRLLSFRLDKRWRVQLINSLAQSKFEKTLDLCCGSGDLLFPLSRKTTGLLVGGDFTAEMLAVARRRSDVVASKASLLQADALSLPFASETFDLVTVSFGVRNFYNLEKGLTEIRRVLRPRGQLRILEFGSSSEFSLTSKALDFYNRLLLPRLGHLITGKGAAYEYLQESIRDFPAAENFLDLAEGVGFRRLFYKKLTFGAVYLYGLTI